jgi:hemoglobin/transferrin/lactoferrin receptor protein
MQTHVHSRRKWLYLAVVSALSWQPLTSIAADSADAGLENTPTWLDTVVTSATKSAKPLRETIGTVSLIDRKSLDEQLAGDFSEALRYEPNLSMRSAMSRFGLQDLNVRGIEGNRVLVEVDGIRVPDSFAIGSFSNATRNTVDIEMLESIEVLRGPASSLYGSSALGGVVSLRTLDPNEMLQGAEYHVGTKSGYDSADQGWVQTANAALGFGTWSGSISIDRHERSESDNFGRNDSLNSTRTKPNPQQQEGNSVLAKLVNRIGDDQLLRVTLDAGQDRTETDVLTSRVTTASGPSQITTTDLDGIDEQSHQRVSVDYEFATGLPLMHRALVQVYGQRSETEQQTFEDRSTRSAPNATPVLSERDRSFLFDQDIRGLEFTATAEFDGSIAQTLTWGAEWIATDTEQLRTGITRNLATGTSSTVIGPDNFPVRDFPLSTTTEWAAYVQDEIRFAEGSFTLLPGLRFDRFELDPEVDAIFSADNPGITPTNVSEQHVSPKLGALWQPWPALAVHAQYAEGFRAPPYADVNVGFTNLQFGYSAIPNPDLKSETSRGIEVGFRNEGRFGYSDVTWFDNRYDDFIESFVNIGFDANGIMLFQSQNLTRVRIHGVEWRGLLELAELSDALSGFRINAALGGSAGKDLDTGTRLASIDPAKAVLGLSWNSADDRFGAQLIGTGVKRNTKAAQGQFQTPGYGVIDALARMRIGDHVDWRIGVFNLADRKYWQASSVRGRTDADVTLDRFTESGRYVSTSVSLNW